ncbi:MAG: hypothetical protein KatS3mg009_2561 [Acidimicrobiia bacterium]|nr:MAG: hypothetical protein KatS3mg009_2561 [Acidimicrobiia bacterium]
MPASREGLLTTVAWQIGDARTYAMEGAIFVTGAAIQWLRDGLGIVSAAAETGPLAESVPDSGGCYLVPAFTGLGSPWWDPYARGTIVGITRGTTRATSRAPPWRRWRTRPPTSSTRSPPRAAPRPPRLRVDGGASVMDLLCRFQADLLGIPVRRAAVQETTALGAAFLAGLAEGVWDSPATVNATWRADASFEPAPDRSHGRRAAEEWRRAVERARDWARDP